MKLPKYQRIKDDLKLQIESGKFESGDRFYTESQIIQHYQVSSITAIRALNELAKSGYIIREQGKGSFVSRTRKHTQTEFSDIEVFPISKEHVTVLSITKEQDSVILKHLNLSKKEFYYKIVRVRHAMGIPYILQHSYIPEEFIKSETPSNYYQSIYQRFKSDFNIHMNQEKWTETNEIIYPVSNDIAQHLALPEPSPVVFQVKKTMSSLNGKIYEYVEAYKRWDHYKIEVTSRT